MRKNTVTHCKNTHDMLLSEFNLDRAIKEKRNLIDHLKEFLQNHDKGEYLLNSDGINRIMVPADTINIDSHRSALIVVHELSQTGAPVVSFDLAKILLKKGFFVVIVSLKRGGMLSTDINEYGIPIIYMQDAELMQYTYNGFMIKKIDLDAFVECFDEIFMVTLTLYDLIKRYMFSLNRRIYWWIHEGSEAYNLIGDKMPVNITPNIKVLCGGWYCESQLIEHKYNYHTEILNYGVRDFYYEGRKKKNTKKVTFLLGGTLCKRKGQKILLEAIKILPQSVQKNAIFIFVGDPYPDDVDGKKIQDDITRLTTAQDCIFYYRAMSREKILELYNHVDVLIVSSTDDPMPVIATENLMMGNVLMCSENTGQFYYIRDGQNGFIFNINDVESLCRKITYAVENQEELEVIGARGRQIFKDFFDMDIFERNVEYLLGKSR